METNRKPVHTQLAVNVIAKQFDLHGMFDDKGNTYFQMTNEQTANNLHDELSGALNEAGFKTYTTIKIGRGKHSKGNQYARVTVQEAE
jgi:hypothetical protein